MSLLLSPMIELNVTSMTCFLVVLTLDMIVEQIIMKLIILDSNITMKFCNQTTIQNRIYYIFIPTLSTKAFL